MPAELQVVDLPEIQSDLRPGEVVVDVVRRKPVVAAEQREQGAVVGLLYLGQRFGATTSDVPFTSNLSSLVRNGLVM